MTNIKAIGSLMFMVDHSAQSWQAPMFNGTNPDVFIKELFMVDEVHT